MKYFLSIIVAVITLFLIIVNFSAVESKYICTGSLTNAEGKSEIFVQLEKYRPWVGLWSKSDGNMKAEVPLQTLSYYEHLQKAGNTYGVFSKEGGTLEGSFSTLSRYLSLKISNNLVFEGRCNPL
jgi:hypothetical protein